MNKKPIKLSPKRGGHGHITSYSINIGSAEAKECGFITDGGSYVELEKIIDPKHHRIIIQIGGEGDAV